MCAYMYLTTTFVILVNSDTILRFCCTPCADPPPFNLYEMDSPQNSSGKTPSSEPCVPPTSTDAVAAPSVPDPQPQHSSSKVILSPKAATIQHASNLVCAIHAVLDDGSSQNDGVAYGQAISKFFPKLPFTNDTSWYHAELVPQAHPHPDVDSINMLKLWINDVEYHTPTRYQLFLLAEPAFVLHYVFLSFFHVSYRGY